MKTILGMGNALTDVLFQLTDNQPLSHFKLPIGSMQLIDADFSRQLKKYCSSLPKTMVAGGSAANTINGIARLGGQTAFIGKVRQDEIGSFFKHDLENNGVRPKLIYSTTTTSGNCTVLISPDGERTMCTYLGAACELEANELHSDLFTDSHLLHIEGYLVQNHALIETAMQIAKQQGLAISIDLASYNIVAENKDFLLHLIKEYVDIVFANEEEALALTNKQPIEALAEIATYCHIAIVKVGAKGSYIQIAQQTWHIDAIHANCIDTTGAGDLYAAGFLYGWTNNWPIDRCGQIGSLVAGKTVETIGTKLTDSVWKEIKQHI